MDDLDRREAFLLAIFANPDDDLPRLVFAEYLDERGEHDWAELIRVQCELHSQCHDLNNSEYGHLFSRELELIDMVFPQGGGFASVRGFRAHSQIKLSAELLSDPVEFRRKAIVEYPEWYFALELVVTSGLIASSKPISTSLTSPVTQKVTKLDLAGSLVETTPNMWMEDGTEYELSLTDFTYRPVVTLQAVEALVNARECRRITHLDLRYNDLDNDAARVILRSTNLIRLQSLHLFDGNRLRGRTWAQLQERFGEDVVQ